MDFGCIIFAYFVCAAVHFFSREDFNFKGAGASFIWPGAMAYRIGKKAFQNIRARYFPKND